MENHDNRNEEMPKAQSMQATDKKHTILVYTGLGCWLLGLIFGELRLDGLWTIFTLAGLVLNCIGLYMTLKYRKLTKRNVSSTKDDK